MKRYIDTKNNFGIIWQARTKWFTVELLLERSFEPYDGDDEDGSIQQALDAGDLVMFDSKVSVSLWDGSGKMAEIAAEYLGASVYETGKTARFLSAGYFMDMLHEACNAARKHVNSMPRMREGN